MIQTLPSKTLLRYVYNELPAEQQQETEQALRHDPELATACADLLSAQRCLDGVSQGPSARTIESILQYSRTFMPAS